MRSLTGREVQEEHARLEREAATCLGYIHFEYSRIDFDLGLLLAWANDGRDLEALTKKLNVENVNVKLDLLGRQVEAKFHDHAMARKSYLDWLDEAHQARNLRNQLFHGRWCINPTQESVSCVFGSRTSSEQQSVSYSIGDLRDALDSLRSLRTRLRELRDQWPYDACC